MNSDRIKEIQSKTPYPESVSVHNALHQVWNETYHEQESEIAALKQKVGELKDFCIWLTGCRYDFTQHEYYLKTMKRLMK
ncbi:MAG: hypothetical protein DRO67_00570 [Candidatus Asgardarchaeum californiense]|nr:MAG: hypothetical protein DRO67_00570 [Candidatus Asgardarchaeum californiense]